MSPAQPTALQAACYASTIGIDQTAWRDHYYPEECPEDWRLAYFMNDFQGVYLPASEWHNQAKFMQTLKDEIEQHFEIVLAWPALNSSLDIYETLAQLKPIEQHIACLVIDFSSPLDRIETLLNTLNGRFNIAFDLNIPPDDAALSFAKKHQASWVWRPALNQQPSYSGTYQVVRLACLPMRALTPILRTLKQPLVHTERIKTALFFEPGTQSVQVAIDARTLIELLDLT